MKSFSRLMRHLVTSIMVLSSTIPTSLTAETDHSKPAGSCFITVGWEPWEPYMYLTPGTEVSGLDIEILEALAQEAGCILNYKQANWRSLLVMIQNGEVDVLPGASISESRKSFALFSESYREEHFAFYVNFEDLDEFPITIQSLVEGGKKIGVTSGYMYGDELTYYQDSESYAEHFVETAIGEANIYSLLQHSIDVFVEDPFVATYNLQRKGLSDQIKQLPIDIHTGDIYLMFSKQTVEQEVVDRFNKALAKIKKNTVYKRITERYQL